MASFADGETTLLQERHEVMEKATEWDVLYNYSIFFFKDNNDASTDSRPLEGHPDLFKLHNYLEQLTGPARCASFRLGRAQFPQPRPRAGRRSGGTFREQVHAKLGDDDKES